MTLDQLEMLEAIVAEGSMQKAAKRLNKSQPSLSVGIKKIEEEFGLQVLSREGYRPRLTKLGEVFFLNAQQVLKSTRNLYKVAHELGSGLESEVRIAVDPLVSLSHLEKVFKVAMSFQNTTKLSLFEAVLEGPIQSLAEQKAQLAVGHCPPHRMHEVHSRKICKLQLIPVVKRGGHESVVPNIFVTSNFDSIQPQPSTWYVSSHDRKEELILLGLGWGRISKDRLNQYKNRLMILRSKAHHSIDLDIYAMIHKELPLGQVAQKLWESV